MKLRGNFAFPFDQLVRVLVSAGWGLSVLGTLSLAAMVLGAVHLNREMPDLKDSLEQLRKSPAPPMTAFLPSAGDREKLRSRLKDLDSLGIGGGKPVAATLFQLENLLPRSARLLSFQQDQKTGEIQLTAEGEGLEELSGFLAALENDGSFSKVTLTKQSRSQGKDGNWIQFSIDLSGGTQ